MKSRFFLWELRHLRAESTPWVVLLLLALLTAAALVSGARHYHTLQLRQTEAREESAAAERNARALAAQLDAGTATAAPARDPRRAIGYGFSHLSVYATKPPRPLSALSVGQSDLYPEVNKVTVASRDSAVSGVDYENPQRLLIGRFDVSFVIIYVLPLLLIGLTYNVVSGERERGTLPLLLLQQGSAQKLAWGRGWFAGGLVLAGLAILLVAGLAAVGLLAVIEPVALGAWLGAALAYGAFWIALALWVASRGGSSATNAVVLAGTWLLFTIVVPSLVSVAAKTLHPVPSRMTFITAQREVADEAVNRRSRLLAAYYEDHPELAPQAAQQAGAPNPRLVADLTYRERERQLAPVRARYAAQLERQQALVDKLKFLSPALLAQSAFNELSGTSLERHRRYQEQASAYHDTLRAYFQPRINADEPFTAYDEVPKFAFADEPGSHALRRGALLSLTLLGAAGLLLFASRRALKRYPVAG